MEEDFLEEVFNGFCKSLNETRSVFCEFERKDGRMRLESADCDYGECPHSKTCLLMEQAKEIEGA